MSEWVEPIWTRALQDVSYAVALNNKIKNTGWDSLTAQEKDAWIAGLVGCLNAVDLNRIEGNTAYLSDLLNERGYTQVITEKTDWGMQDYPISAEMERVLGNIETLINNYHPVEVPLPESLDKSTYQTINAVERVLGLMKDMIHRMEKEYRYAGTFAAGQDLIL